VDGVFVCPQVCPQVVDNWWVEGAGGAFDRSFWSVFSGCWTCWGNVINVY